MDEKLVKLLLKVGAGIFVLVMGFILINNMIVTVNANEFVVKQAAWSGELVVWDSPGVHWQNFGTITRYPRSVQLSFSVPPKVEKDVTPPPDKSIRVRFNDGGHGNISGSLRYALPTNPEQMILLHKNYHNPQSIDADLVQQVVNKGVYMSGPLMSSRESYAEKRADLINYITDQIEYGVYKTERETVKTVDPITGQEKEVDLVRPRVQAGAPNGFGRQEVSPIQTYGIVASNITINGIDYDETVEKQIQQQQQAIMAVQQAIVNAKKAEQDTLTVEQQGKAEAAKAKWAQEVEKATAVTSAEKDKAVAVTQAEKDKEVAALSLETARLAAQETITKAKAEADANRMAMQSNNYFLEKLNAAKEVAIHEADARGAQPQVPQVSVGSGGGGASNAGQDLLGLALLKMSQAVNK